MSNDPLQPQETADIEGQNAPLDDVIAAGEETADLVEESPVIEEIDGETPEALDDAAASAVEEAAAPAVEEIHEAVAFEEHPHKKHSFFDRLFGHKEEEVQPEAMTVEQPAAEEGVVEPAAAETSAETPAETPVFPALAAIGLEDVEAVVREEMERAQSEILAAIPPAINLEDVKAVVQEEISRAEGQIQNTIQAEVARLENDSARREYEAAQDTMADFYRSKSDMIAAKVELLKQRQAVVFNDTSRPIKEVKEDVGMISEMLGEAEADLAELQKIVTNRAAVTSELVASLGAREQIAALQRQVEEQKNQVAALDEKVKSRTGGAATGKAGLNWWQLLGLALLLIVGIGASALYLKSSMVNQKPAALMVETAGLYQSTGDTEEAVRVLDEAIATGIKDAQVLGRAGEMYRLLKQYDKAIDALNKALAKEPDNETYLLSLARAYGSSGKQNEAIYQYQKLINDEPLNITYYIEMGHRYRSLKDYEQALTQYQKALEINPQKAEIYLYQGDIFRDQHKYDNAIAQYQKALAILPNYYLAQLWTGLSYMEKNEPSNAIKYYQMAIANSPDRYEAYRYLGDAYMSQANYEMAQVSYQQSIERNNKSAIAYIGLGNAYIALDDCSNAGSQFLRALILDPKNNEAQQGLSACTGK